MKLQTKFQDEDFELGEVVDADIFYGGAGNVKIECMAKKGGYHTFYFDTLKELNEKFEDYEEPKEHWAINEFGTPEMVGRFNRENIYDKARKIIGNDFETKEETEQAAERLRAWRRLKDKGFSFDGYEVVHDDRGNLCGKLFYKAGDYCIEDADKDLDLLFGGEDE